MAQTELRLDGLGIRKIVEIPPGVKVLSISSNRLRNLGSVLECLTLQEVNLAANKLDENALAPLAALPALRVLNVSRNHIRDLSPLVLAPPALASQGHAFPSLEDLNISSNPLSDVTAAMSLQVLRVLTAASLATTTLQCVHCSLEVIDVRSCCLQSISGLQALPYLSELILDGNALLSCKDFGSHSSLQALRLVHNAIGEISAVQLPCLTELDLASNNLSQALNLAGAPRLVSLVLRTNQLTSLVQLSALRCLTFLDASQNKIRTLEPSLRWSLRPLRVLLLNGNEIHDVEDVAKTMEMAGGLALEHLDLRDNPLSLAFYPFAERLPTWTWEARASFSSFATGQEQATLHEVHSQRDRYCNRLTSICPSLQSLDGLLVDGTVSQSSQSLQPISDGPSRPSWLGGEDEVLYSTPRQSREATALNAPKVGDEPGDQDSLDRSSHPRKEKSHMEKAQIESIAKAGSIDSEAKIVTSDAATSPVFREGPPPEMSQMSALANLGLAPELLAAQRRSTPVSSETQPEMVLAMEVAAAAAAAAVVATSAEQACACAERGAARESSTSPLPADSGADSKFQSYEPDGKYQADGQGPLTVSVEDLMYKGEEFEVQQLHIVEKLEKAHQELAKQWQELDTERQMSNEQQEEQRQRIQLFAKEQAEVQAGLQVQFESEMQKRHEWEAHQQHFLEQQQQQLEDQWQREQERRKQQWEKEQEEEFSKLQQRFQQLQQQFQERLDSAVQPRARDTQLDVHPVSKKTSDVPKPSRRADVAGIPSQAYVGMCCSGQGCLRGCLQGFHQRPKVPEEPQIQQEPLTWHQGDARYESQHAEAEPRTVAVGIESSEAELNEALPVLKEPRAEPIGSPAEASCLQPEPRPHRLAEPAEPISLPVQDTAEPVAQRTQRQGSSAPIDPFMQTFRREPAANFSGVPLERHSDMIDSQTRAKQFTSELRKPQSKHEELPGSDGAFQRALHGRGIWQLEDREDRSSLKITASLDADRRVVSEGEQGARDLPKQASPAHSFRNFSPKKEQYLKFLQKEIAAQRAFLRDIKTARKASHSDRMNVGEGHQVQMNRGGEGSRSQATSLRKVHFGGSTQVGVSEAKEMMESGKRTKSQESGQSTRRGDESAWHCVVSPVNAGVRGALEALISQQAWSVPGRPFAYLYSLGRAIQNSTLPARQHFDALVTRDASREGVVSPLGFSQRAFFCDKNTKLSEVIASPFGFGTVYQGMAILVALELRHAERLCWPETAHLTGRTIVAEIALGRCHTSHTLPVELASLERGLTGAVPLAKDLEMEYRRGADSVYFPKMGVIAILSPTRALPVFLAEYSRELVGAST